METKQVNKYFDSDPKREWWMRFDVLRLPEQHRKILNRGPKIGFCFHCGGYAFKFDKKVMAN